jgi:hypothetical protein
MRVPDDRATSGTGPDAPGATPRLWRRRAAQGVLRVLVVVVAVGGAVGGRELGLGALATVLATVSFGAAGLFVARRRRPRRPPALVAIVVLVVLGLLSAAAWSYTNSLDAPGSDPTAVKAGDWMRGHGLTLVADRFAHSLYAGTPPGDRVARKHLPAVGVLGSDPATIRIVAAPGALAPATVRELLGDPFPGEGRWTPGGRLVAGRPVAYTTFVRPDRDHTGVVASAVWLDPMATHVTYVPGTKQRGPWGWGSGIPKDQRSGLVAAFNAGFQFKDLVGGYRTEGRTPVPLVDGQASLVLRAHGLADVGAWGSDVHLGDDVTAVRQNLALVVDHGKPVPGLHHKFTGAWGSPRWQLQYTNRSGIGITRDHALVYVAGAELDTASLGEALAEVGAVRAMELDIHANNPTFNFFDPSRTGVPVVGAKLAPWMKSSSTRFLAPDKRDFFAVTIAEQPTR